MTTTLPFHRIKRVAVLGSGVMGSAIACHLAQCGAEVMLLDLPADEGPRDGVAAGHLAKALKSKPSPIYSKRFASRIETGNFDDDLPAFPNAIGSSKSLSSASTSSNNCLSGSSSTASPAHSSRRTRAAFPLACSPKGAARISASTSAAPTSSIRRATCSCWRSFPGQTPCPKCWTSSPHTASESSGKQSVLCKDTPAFIANRVGVFAIQALFHTVEDMGLSVEAVDKLTGPAMGRPKSATFRTCDVVGLDTLVHVAKGVADNCPDDERAEVFAIPSYVKHLVDQGWLGSKSGQGFYKKVVTDGKKEIHALDLKTLEYKPKQKVQFATLAAAKNVDDLRERTKLLFNGQDQAGEFYRRIFADVFAYVSHRVPEISDEPYRIDDALRAGFGWELGAFESWDAIGLQAGLDACAARGLEVAQWVHDLAASGATGFYGVADGKRTSGTWPTKSHTVIPGQDGRIALSLLGEDKTVWANSGTTIQDLGDGILNIAFHTKMNTIGAEVIEGLNKVIDLAESDPQWRGVVISNEGGNFSAGANVGMIFMLAVEQEWDELDYAIRMFQNTTMRLRYSGIPVVAAPHQLTLGGGCEVCLHVDKVVAHAESYIGLVEFGVGLIPGGGGTKEFVLRLHDGLSDGDVRINAMRERFLTIGQAKVATSAYEAFELGYLREGVDEVVVNRRDQLARAKAAALAMADQGYTQPVKRKDITVMGQEGMGIVYAGASSMASGNYISEHDQLISEKLGYVMCGGDLSARTDVSEQYLLDLERRAFLELCTKRKTLERMQSLIQKGKILRN